MTDNEIIKALECCSNAEPCTNCPYQKQCDETDLAEIALNLINRQQAEIERLKHNNIAMARHALILCRENYKEGVKDFAKRFENELTQIEEIYIDEEHENFISANKVIALLVNLAKEMVGEG